MRAEDRAAHYRRRLRTAVLVGGVLAATLLPHEAPAAEPGVSRVELTATLAPSGDRVEVVMRHRLHLQPGTESVLLRTLAFLGAEPTHVRARLAGQEVEVEMVRSTPSVVSGRVWLPHTLADTGAVDLELRYLVAEPLRRRGADLDVTVPILLVLGRPLGSPQRFFTAEIRVPAEHVVYESFPTVPRSMKRVGTQNHYSLALQVAPAMLRWRAGVGESPLFSFDILVDLFTVGMIVILSFATYRGVRSSLGRQGRKP